MLSLLSCSVSRLDDFDVYAPPPSQLRKRSISRSLSFKKSAITFNVKRSPTTTKMNIGSPMDFRHQFHIGKDAAADVVLDSARWQQELEKVHVSSFPPSSDTSRSSPPSSISPSSFIPASPTTPSGSKRNSITPQRRKPVPSIVPIVPPLPPSPQDIPLPPSPREDESSDDCHVESRQSMDTGDGTSCVTQAAEEPPMGHYMI